jgi:membrane protease YdiL (CAAX protease family)
MAMIRPEVEKPGRRLLLAGEFLGAWFVLPMLCVMRIWPWHPFLLLAPVGVLAVIWLMRQPDFAKSRLLDTKALRTSLPRIGLTFVGLGLPLVALLALVLPPEQMFYLPRHRPGIWAILLVAYTIISVYPQELLFRAFMFHRYAPLFRTTTLMIVASAISFAFMHVVFRNWVAPVLCLGGGFIFSLRYQRTQSVLITSIEHALWGMLMLSIGLERCFLTSTHFVFR